MFAFEVILKKTFMIVSYLYFWPFEFLLKALRALGMLGELFFTIFGLFWLLWPLYVAYKLDQREYWIGATVLSVILSLRGRIIIIRN